MKTRIPFLRAASLLALLSSSLAVAPSVIHAQAAASSSAVQATPPVSGQPVADAATAVRAQIAQFRQQLEGLSPIEARDALRQYIETNFPGGVPTIANDAAAINENLAQQDNKPLPALKLPADAAAAQIAYLRARRQLVQAFRVAKRAAFGANASLTPEQRCSFARQWQQNQGSALLAQVRQKAQALLLENQRKVLQRRQSLAASAAVVLSRLAQTEPALAAALAQRHAISAEAGQIMARPDLTTPQQRRDAVRQWHEANKERIDAAREAVVSARSVDEQQSTQTPIQVSP